MSRFDSVAFDEKSREHYNKIRDTAIELESMIAELSPTRVRQIALTKLEECIVWANKAIRDDQILRPKLAEETEE